MRMFKKNTKTNKKTFKWDDICVVKRIVSFAEVPELNPKSPKIWSRPIVSIAVWIIGVRNNKIILQESDNLC